MAAGDYAGELTSAEAFRLLQEDAEAVLVDVRTLPEWQFVGVPDLRPLGRTPLFVSWQLYPDMETNRDFAKVLSSQGVAPAQTVLLICRSGFRSRAAAIALNAAGFERAFNVSDGFEGPLDDGGHRGKAGGWKAASLPWVQQ